MSAPIRPPGDFGSWLELRRPSLESPAKDAPSFADLFKTALNDASGLEDHSKQLIGAFLRGEPVELHDVMAASEEASISLELLVEIRNKLTDAYRQVMNVQ